MHRKLRGRPETLDELWKGNADHFHFSPLLRLLHDKSRAPVQKQWLHTIRRAAILAGQSYVARSLPEAFLLDMIAIEVLLARRGDKFPNALTERLMALFGWMTDEDPVHWKEHVERLYECRCSYVHAGHVPDLSGTDLFNADTLLKNLLTNVCSLSHHIRQKDDLLELAHEYQARRTLGLKPSRPKGISFSHMALSDHAIDAINSIEQQFH